MKRLLLIAALSVLSLPALAGPVTKGDVQRLDLDQITLDGTVVTATGAELNTLDGVTATTDEINRAADVSSRIVNATAATLTVTESSHEGKVVTLNRAAGIAVTLPDATGSGAVYRFVTGTTVTSNSTTIKVANASDTFVGLILQAQDGGATVQAFECGSTDDTLTFNGTTTGGIKGDYVEIIDVAADLFLIQVRSSGTGTEATACSATVS